MPNGLSLLKRVSLLALLKDPTTPAEIADNNQEFGSSVCLVRASNLSGAAVL